MLYTECQSNKFSHLLIKLKHKYRVIKIIRVSTDGCRSRPWLAGPLPHRASNCRCSQTLALFFNHCNTGNCVHIPVHVNKTTPRRQKKFVLHPVLQSLPFLTLSYKIAVSYMDLADVTRAQVEFYMASVTSVILLLFVQTTQILQFPVINVLEVFTGVCSNLSPNII